MLVIGAGISGFSAAIITPLGGSLLTAVLVGVLYESFQKQSLVSEISAAMRIRASIAQMGFRAIERGRDLDLQEVIQRAQQITALPLDPIRWVQTEFGELLDAA